MLQAAVVDWGWVPASEPDTLYGGIQGVERAVLTGTCHLRE